MGKISDKFYGLLRRKTATTSFIPEIDGLRFLAIVMVVLFHINIFVAGKVPFVFNKPGTDYWWMWYFLESDRKGVLLFFIISGFILALPFAKAARGEGKPVELKKYFLRRLTRLEPPYFLVMTAAFLGILFFPGHDFVSMFPKDLGQLLPRLAASLGYVHNIVFPQHLSVNPVAWSLEIEVQFYLLVPLLVSVFKWKAPVRRAVLLAAMAGLVLIHQVYKPATYTLYQYMQYFLLGFLLADLYLSGFKLNLRALWAVPLGLVSLAYIWYSDVRLGPGTEFIFIFSALVLYLLALTDNLWRKVFSLRFLTAIGGMCYSIYLLHYLIIPVIGNETIKINFFKSYPLAYVWHALILLPVVLVCSACFYLLIEKPCMDKDWPFKLWYFIKRLFGKTPAAAEPAVVAVKE